MKSNRRKFLKNVGLGATALGLGSSVVSCAPGTQAATPEEKSTGSVEASVNSSVAQTANGKVLGYISNGIFVFKGIPYGESTAGENRFMPPVKPKPWTDIKSALAFGSTCPRTFRGGWLNNEEKFLMQWSDGIPGEDCLSVNVWTSKLDNSKRPVMVWIHGGGFTSGSSEELPAYDGENLVKRGDVVVVSLNHRLNIFGFLDLSEIGGEKYASSGNVGMLDIVAALEWIRDNIANFGGDPGNVTIFGQSGGGSKVGTLLGMPSAKGLFHKAIVQSGSGLRQREKTSTTQVATEVMNTLKLNKSSLKDIHTLPWQTLLETSASVPAAINAKLPNTPTFGFGGGGVARAGWGPVVDGKIIPQHTFDPVASEISKDIPMMIGTVANESSAAFANPAGELTTLEDIKARLEPVYGDRAPAIIEAYQKNFPNAGPPELISLMGSLRTNAIKQSELKTAQGGAPVYLYWFTWKTPVLDGRPRSFHCSELAFVFDNIDRCINATGGGKQARDLAAKMSTAWINFAKTGNPNHDGLPEWKSFTAENGETMVFDNQPELKNDPDREARMIITAKVS